MTTLSTAAWVGHDLGIATGVGGTLFGQLALPSALKNITDEEERGAVIRDAWETFNTVQLAGLGLAALTWFAGRTQLSGAEAGGSSRGLTIAKDVFVLGALASAVGNRFAGQAMSNQGGGLGVPADADGDVSPRAPEASKKLEPLVRGLGVANLVCSVGVVVTTAILAMNAGRSTRWSLVSRFLP